MKVGREYEGTVIKPPLDSATSGRLFKPSSKLRNKYWFEAIIMSVIFWIITVGTFFGTFYLIGYEWAFDLWWYDINFWFWVLDLAWLIPALIFIPIWVNSFEYSVRAMSGESMPEVYVKKGIITVTRKHVPFRTITNIASKAGPLDRLFGIGSVEIETAGFSGIAQEGPEEKITGIVFYEELRDFILQELRKFKEPYVTGTEVGTPFDDPVPRMDGTLDDEILITLRHIRDVLRRIDEKLDRGGL
jgi:membrane protein YdbS with pleckstrin-like domain